MQSRKQWITIFSLIASSTGCSDDNKAKIPEQESVPRIRYARVHECGAGETIWIPGTLSPEEEIKLGFISSGTISRIYVRVGQEVRKGQRLASLDAKEFTARQTSARRAFEKAGRDMARTEDLFKANVATLEQVQDSKTAFSIAKSDLEIADWAGRRNFIVSPGDGKVLGRLFLENESVAAGSPVLIIAMKKKGWSVIADVADRDAMRLNPGDSARVSFDALPGAIFHAHVDEIASRSSGSGGFEIRLAMRDPSPRFLSGLVGKIELCFSSGGNCLMVPAGALVEAKDGNGFIFAADSGLGTVQKRKVHIAFVHGHGIAIDAGLEGVTDVVADGAAYLSRNLGAEVAKRRDISD